MCSRCSQEEKKELDEITAKRQKKGRNEEESPAEEKTVLHGTVNHTNLVVASQCVMSLTVVYYMECIVKLNTLFVPTVKDMYDYQGRSYLHIPQDVGINLRTSDIPDKCYLPKKQIHVWSGHTKVSGT